MLQRLRRPAALISVPALLLTLAACGDGSQEEFAKGFDAVSISGDVGATPKFDWKKQMESAAEQTKTLVEGDGAKIADGDQVLVNFTIGNGFTEQVSLDTYSDTVPGFVATVGAKAGQPQLAGDLLTDFVAERIKPGMTIGTRFAITAGVDKALKDYQTAFTAYDIGNADGLVFVVDLVGSVLDGPNGKEAAPAAWAPRLVEKKGVPSSLDFTGTPAPSDKLKVTTLIEGEGQPVSNGTVAVVNYLGQVYDGPKPFDASYPKDTTLTVLVGAKTQPLQNSAAATPVIKGWSKGLVGVPAGSRVLIQIPPKLGYGKQKQKAIPANSTLYFVVDVLGVA